MTYIIITFILILILLSGFFKGLSDRVENITLYDKSKFFPKNISNKWYKSRDYYSKAESYGRKWKNNSNSFNGEKFLFSSTFLVALTDFWHLSNMFSKLFNIVSIIISANYLMLNCNIFLIFLQLIILLSVWSIGFTLSYSIIFKK